MPNAVSELARRLARDPEAVCRHYLSKGRREGRYWLVGDVENTAGRSLYVRLTGPESGQGAAGKWTDAATGDHGDLLDLIAASRRLDGLQALDEARHFRALPRFERPDVLLAPARTGSPEAARRLFATSKPIRGTTAETYLQNRGITDVRDCTALRYHPNCFYRPDHNDDPNVRDAWPAMIAGVTNLDGVIVGAHRTWLDPATADKARVATPRRAMGLLLGHGVRIGRPVDVLAAGEGIESTLSLRMAFPTLPSIACLSASHLAAMILPAGLRHLYIAREDDRAGRQAASVLRHTAAAGGVEPLMRDSACGDLNEDLRHLDIDEFSARMRQQLAPEHVARFSEERSIGRRPTASLMCGARPHSSP